MQSLFELHDTGYVPLAERLRPKTFEELLGQDHILSEHHMLRNMFSGGQLTSLIFWGPPGSGKTTLARMIAEHSNCQYETVSAVSTGVAELKALFERARAARKDGLRTVVFVDEIHRFTRSQQDVFLPVVEDGTIILIGATTENPSFEINSALLSRMQVVVLKRLEHEALSELLVRAESNVKRALPVTNEAREALINMADGDGRALLNFCEVLFGYRGKQPLDTKALGEYIQRRAPVYDKHQDSHYNLISALHKSLRGSDVNAALYWLARMLAGGENPLYIARRMVRFAVEDIGLADPHALVQANAAKEAYDFLGTPEGELALAQCVVYLATAPKSNALYRAFQFSARDAEVHGSLMPPMHILNSPTKMMKEMGYGKGYEYDHEAEEAFSGQNYFPEGMKRSNYYEPVERGFEREIIKRLEYWEKLRQKKTPVS